MMGRQVSGSYGGSYVLHQSDWLASQPFFFSSESSVASTNFNEVVSALSDVSFNAEGSYNYLDYGYSVFGQTPIDGVRFLPPASRAVMKPNGVLHVEDVADPLEQWWEYKLSESDIVDLIKERVQSWEKSLPTDQEIVLPLSGGFDSRLLLWCLSNTSRLRSYTYGISQKQNDSTEVVHARALANRFDVRWEMVSLGEFHKYFDEWDALFGASTHAHGMYHYEFYTKIRERLNGRYAFLSGIIGDAWAGSVAKQTLETPGDLLKLGLTHGLRADPERLRLSVPHDLRESFWYENKEKLGDYRYQVVTTIRMKIMLISYLMRVPREFGFEPWSPYLDIDVAMAMLNLPPERRRNRQWQRDFFSKVGLDLESQGLKSNRSNSLNLLALKKVPVKPLDRDMLSTVIDRDYIDWINKTVKATTLDQLRSRVLRVPKVGGALRRFGVRDKTLEAYHAYLCLRPLENVITKYPSASL